jgi:hypothetical protein
MDNVVIADIDQISTAATYTYSGAITGWEPALPSGIAYSGAANDGDTITVSYTAATPASTVYETAKIYKSELADYFKIGSNEEDLKVFKL